MNEVVMNEVVAEENHRMLRCGEGNEICDNRLTNLMNQP